MPLPLPNLDDKQYEQILYEALTRLPTLAPGWTDHNAHDPGITLIELLAWITEMEQYYINRVRPASYQKFLELLGSNLLPATPAQIEVEFFNQSSVSAPIFLPQGTKLRVGNQIFETESSLQITKSSIDKIITKTTSSIVDVTSKNTTTGLTFLPFGESPDQSSYMYLGFSPANFKLDESSLTAELKDLIEQIPNLEYNTRENSLVYTTRMTSDQYDRLKYPIQHSHIFECLDEASQHTPFTPGKEVSLYCDLNESYSVPVGAHGTEIANVHPSALIGWEYYSVDGRWKALNAVTEIIHLIEEHIGLDSRKAPLCSIDRESLLKRVSQAAQYQYLSSETQAWLCNKLSHATNSTAVLNILRDQEFIRLAGDDTQMLSQSGALRFTAPHDMAVRKIRPLEETLFWIRASVISPGYELPPEIDRIRLNTTTALNVNTLCAVDTFSLKDIESDPIFTTHSYLPIARFQDSSSESSIVQVQRPDGLWKDWTCVRNLTDSKINDEHFTLRGDEESIQLQLGDDEHGARPPKGDNVIRLISPEPESEAIFLGESNGLPQQRFTLPRENLLPDELVIQVGEEHPVPSTSAQSIHYDCFLNFKRALTHCEDDHIEVTILITAIQNLRNISITENFSGNLEFVDGDVEQVSERQISIEIESLAAGSTLTKEYQVAVGREGGLIQNEIWLNKFKPGYATLFEGSLQSRLNPLSIYPDILWRDYERVNTFDSSKPHDPHYMIDFDLNEIVFGDGIQGLIPAANRSTGSKNIRIINLKAGGGTDGNVKQNQEVEIISSIASAQEISVTTYSSGHGGRERENLEIAQRRIQQNLRTPYRTVTSEDFEYIAKATPGLRVARAHAIPLYQAGMMDYPQNRAEGTVTVVVIPHSNAPKPIPSPNFLRTVCEHLDRHRLLTTKLHVVAPEYTKVEVTTLITPEPGVQRSQLQARVEEAIDTFLHALTGGPDGSGWPLGRAVYESEIYQTIENVDGVKCVKRVSLRGQGREISIDANGTLHIPAHNLICAGDHEIVIELQSNECK